MYIIVYLIITADCKDLIKCKYSDGGLLRPLPCGDGGRDGGRGGSVPQSVTDLEVLELELNEQ